MHQSMLSSLFWLFIIYMAVLPYRNGSLQSLKKDQDDIDWLFRSSISPLDNSKLAIEGAYNAKVFMTKVNELTKTGTNRVLEAGWYVWLLQRQYRTERRFKRQIQKKFQSWDNFLQEVTSRGCKYWHGQAKAGLLARVIRDFNKLFVISKDPNHLDKDKWQQLYGSQGISYTSLPELTVEHTVRSIPAKLFKDWTFVKPESPRGSENEFSNYLSSPTLVKAYKDLMDKRAKAKSLTQAKAQSKSEEPYSLESCNLEVPMKKKLNSGMLILKTVWQNTEEANKLSFRQFLHQIADQLVQGK
jgi:hypothetical protein